MKVKKKQDSDKYDSVCIELETIKRNTPTIGTVYRPPEQQAADDAALCGELQVMTHNKQSVITGDFNCPNINWSTMNGGLEGNRLLETLEDTLMTQDLVFESGPDLVCEGRVGKKFTGRDHHLTLFSLRMDHEHLENATKIPEYRKANFSLARELLLQST